MRPVLHSMCFALTIAIALNACDAPKKKTYDLYELTPTTGNNDSYYTPPKNHCMASIASSPSCGGI